MSLMTHRSRHITTLVEDVIKLRRRKKSFLLLFIYLYFTHRHLRILSLCSANTMDDDQSLHSADGMLRPLLHTARNGARKRHYEDVIQRIRLLLDDGE